MMLLLSDSGCTNGHNETNPLHITGELCLLSHCLVQQLDESINASFICHGDTGLSCSSVKGHMFKQNKSLHDAVVVSAVCETHGSEFESR